MPRANPNLLPRGRMLHTLGGVLESALTLVVAPMGYGKTTAVYEWVERSGAQAAWLSLDEGDNDPILFWKYVCAACETILPGVLRRVEYAFLSRQLLGANVHINILIDELARHGGKAIEELIFRTEHDRRSQNDGPRKFLQRCLFAGSLGAGIVGAGLRVGTNG